MKMRDDMTANALAQIASAITAQDASPGSDAMDGHVASLTEAVMGMTAALARIADALEDIATEIANKVVS